MQWTACLGLPIDDPQLMCRIMQGLSADADDLKRCAGIRAGVRKLAKPCTHLSLGWAPGQEPTDTEMREAATGVLEAIGIDDRHYGVVVAHNDTPHPHVHVVASRLDPETGKAVTIGPPAPCPAGPKDGRPGAAQGGGRFPTGLSTWVEPLPAQYSRFQQAYPKDWVDVEKLWREQRARWRPLLQERARVVNPPPPPVPAAGAAERAQRKHQSGPHHGR